MALCPALEVVATDEWWALASSLQYEEAPKQPHRWLQPHEHLSDVVEDGHQRNGVGREVPQLEPIILQYREEEGQRRHQPSQGVRRKEVKVPQPHVWPATRPRASTWV
jgi:hypothetical protein